MARDTRDPPGTDHRRRDVHVTHVTSPQERERLFGRWDVVRVCGPDYRDRPREGLLRGLDRPVRAGLPAKTVAHNGLGATDHVYVCTAPGGALGLARASAQDTRVDTSKPADTESSRATRDAPR